MIKDDLNYRRHPGKVNLLVAFEKRGKKDGDIVCTTESMTDRFTPEEARLATQHLFESNRDVSSVSVFSVREQIHFLTYDRRNFADLTSSIDDPEPMPDTDPGGLELPHEREPAALLPRGKKPVPPVDASEQRGVPAAAVSSARPVRNVPPKGPAQPGAKRSTVYELVPGAQPATPLKGNLAALYAAYVRLTAGTKEEILAATVWAEKPPQHPAGFVNSMTSRFKQDGLVRVKE